MQANNAALGCCLIFLGIIFSILAIGHLIYYVCFVIQLSKAHWIVIPIGIVMLGYQACVLLAMQSK